MRLATTADAIEVREKFEGVGVFALCEIREGDEINRAVGVTRGSPTRYTIQVDGDLHLDLTGALEEKLNHSCDPNAAVGFTESGGLILRARRDIHPGDEILINYCATEEDMAEPFRCNCGSLGCYGMIRGFVHLDPALRRGVRELLSPYLEQKYGRDLELTPDGSRPPRSV